MISYSRLDSRSPAAPRQSRSLVIPIVALSVISLPARATGGDEVPQHSNTPAVTSPAPSSTPDSRAFTDEERRKIAHQWRLAQWCQSRGHHHEMIERAEAIVAIDPDHAGARSLLANLVLQPSAPTATSIPPLTPADVRELKRQVERAFRDLTSRSAGTRDIALRTLIKLADTYRIPALRTHAEELHTRVQDLLSPTRNVIVEYRATQSSLVGLPSRTTGVGIGSPVSLQLPELKTVRIGTTVGVPGS